MSETAKIVSQFGLAGVCGIFAYIILVVLRHNKELTADLIKLTTAAIQATAGIANTLHVLEQISKDVNAKYDTIVKIATRSELQLEQINKTVDEIKDNDEKA